MQDPHIPAGCPRPCFRLLHGGAGPAPRTAGTTYLERVAEAAGFHGAYLATDTPDSPQATERHWTAPLDLPAAQPVNRRAHL